MYEENSCESPELNIFDAIADSFISHMISGYSGISNHRYGFSHWNSSLSVQLQRQRKLGWIIYYDCSLPESQACKMSFTQSWQCRK
jgi:hypothetical protein